MAEDIAAFVVVGIVGVTAVTVATSAVSRADGVSVPFAGMPRRVDDEHWPGAWDSFGL